MDDDGDNPNYVTVLPAIHDHAVVAIMRWNYTGQEYEIQKCSQSLQRNAAEALAQSWAAALHLEIR
jgi:hypothetical protein